MIAFQSRELLSQLFTKRIATILKFCQIPEYIRVPTDFDSRKESDSIDSIDSIEAHRTSGMIAKHLQIMDLRRLSACTIVLIAIRQTAL